MSDREALVTLQGAPMGAHGFKQVRVFGGCSTWGGFWGTSACSSEVHPEDRARLGADLQEAERIAGKAQKAELVQRLRNLGKTAHAAEKRFHLRTALVNALIELWWPSKCRDCGRVLLEGPAAYAARPQGCKREGWGPRPAGAAPSGAPGEVV